MLDMLRFFSVPCFFHTITGLYCPGCGMTRAVKALLRGQILESFRYHPVILYLVGAAVLEAVLWIFYRVTGRNRPSRKLFLILLYTGIAVLVINWIVKDYFLIVKGIDLLS